MLFNKTTFALLSAVFFLAPVPLIYAQQEKHVKHERHERHKKHATSAKQKVAVKPSAVNMSKVCANLQVTLHQFRKNNSSKKHMINDMSLYVSQTKDNQPLCYLFSGTIRKGIPQQLTQNNLWEIGSITKSYFAAMMLQLEMATHNKAKKFPIEFDINQKIGQWFPQYPDWGDISVKQLLNMTSGMVSDANTDAFMKMVFKYSHRVWTSEEIIDMSYKRDPNTHFKPGAGYHYSNTSYVLAGELIQILNKRIYNKDWDLATLFNHHIVEPFDLKDTYFYTGDVPQSTLVRMAHGYNYFYNVDTTNYNLSIAQAAGGIIATPKAVAQWVLDLFNGKILAPKELAQMKSLVSMKTGQPMTIQQAMQTNTPGYGLGLMMQPSQQYGPIWMYQGTTYGHTAVYMYVPKYQTIIVYTAGIGSLRKNPVNFAALGKQVLQQLLASKVSPSSDSAL
ncbi:MAG: serine hydrolase [Coxiellaceae bacterium]|nr:serine hydrolase [Coxiellaceae bacterium]